MVGEDKQTPPSSAQDARQGGCLCGAVRFETLGPLRPVVFCHCEQCRRQSGLYFGCTNIADDRLSVAGETLRWFRSSPDVGRGFCGRCGTPLFWKHADLETTSILAGSFDAPSGLVASHHIFTGVKGDFYELPEDGLPRFEGASDDLVLGHPAEG